MPDDLHMETGKYPLNRWKEAPPVENGIDGFVKIENRSNQEIMQCPWKSALDKGEFQLLLGRELESFGYTKTLDSFEKESGVKVRNQMANKLKLAVISGDWTTCIKTIDSVISESKYADADMSHDSGQLASDALNGSEVKDLKFMLYQEIYLELLVKGQIQEAVTLLRERIRFLCTDHRQLQELSSWFLFKNETELSLRSGWPGVSEGRRNLLSHIQENADHRLMTPDHYLANILENRITFYPPDTHLVLDSSTSLLGKRVKGVTGFRLRSSIVLDSPVTHVSFCPRAKIFAYGTEDGSIGYSPSLAGGIIDVSHLKATVTKVAQHPKEDIIIASTLDSQLVVCENCPSSVDPLLVKKFEWPVLACAWYKDYIVATSEEQTAKLFNLKGDLVESLDKKANDVAANAEFIYLAGEKTLLAYRRVTKLEVAWSLGVDSEIASLFMSHDGKTLAADMAESTAIVDAKTGQLINQITVRTSSPSHIIRSCLASNFLVRGYYDPLQDSCSTAYVWSWRTGQLITRINVSDDTIVAAAWDPEERILALASEDHRIYFLEPE